MTEKQVEKELNKQMLAFEDKIKKGLILDMNTTFSEYAELWMQHAEIAPKTRERYVSLLRRINPAIGHIRISKLNKYHVMEFIQQMKSECKLTTCKVTAKNGTKEKIPNYFGSRDKAAKSAEISHTTITEICRGNIVCYQSVEKLCSAMKTDVKKLFNISGAEKLISDNTIQKHYKLINNILNQAVRDDLIPYNPADSAHIKPPKAAKKEARFLKEEQLTKLMGALEKAPIKWYTIVMLSLFTGCRRGELLGLEWSDIDFKKKRIQICRTSQYVNKHIITKSPKTKNGYRTIEISKTAVSLLKSYRSWWLEQRLLLGNLWKNEIAIIDENNKKSEVKNERLFIKNDSTPMNPDSFTQWFSDFSPHALRHTTASLLLADNTDLKTVSGIIEHAQTSTNFEYIWPYYRFTKTAGCGKVRFAYKRPLQLSTLLNQAEHKKR